MTIMQNNQPICALVGAGEGLGGSLAKKFASEGFDIALISRSRSTAEPILEEIQKNPPKLQHNSSRLTLRKPTR